MESFMQNHVCRSGARPGGINSINSAKAKRDEG